MPFYTTGYDTETAATEIVSICPPNGDMIPVLRAFKYRADSSDHNLYVMSPLGRTKTLEFSASGATTLELARDDPGKTTAGVAQSLATGDWIAYRTRSGAVEARKITLSGTTATVAAIGEDVDVGADVWAFYGTSDHGAINLFADALTSTEYDGLHIQCGIPAQRGLDAPVSGSGMPLLFLSDNVTVAGNLDYVQYEWIPASEDFIS